MFWVGMGARVEKSTIRSSLQIASMPFAYIRGLKRQEGSIFQMKPWPHIKEYGISFACFMFPQASFFARRSAPCFFRSCSVPLGSWRKKALLDMFHVISVFISRVSLSEIFFWNHRFLVRGWYQVPCARSSKHWVESRSCQNSIFYFSPLPIKTPFKGMKTVNKFISIDIIFVQTAFNWANTCVYTIYWVDTFKPILATSRVILELNPFGILIRGAILTGRPLGACALKISRNPTGLPD